MDYTTADLIARLPEGQGLSERERRRLMKKQQAGLGLLDTETRMLENDVERRRAVAGPIGGLLAELSGVPSIGRGLDNVQRGMEDGDVMRGLGGAGQIAMGAMPMAGMTNRGAAALASMYSTAPRAGLSGAAMTLPMAYTESAEAAKAKQAAQAPQQVQAEANPDPLTELVKGNPTLEARHRLLLQKEADAKASIPGVNRASSDAVRQKASEEAAAIRSELLSAIDRASAAKREADTTEANKNKSVREIYSEYMPYVAAAPVILGGAGGAVIKGMYNKAFNARTGNVSESWKNAIAGGDKAGALAAQAEMAALKAKGAGGTLPAIAFGAGVGAESSLLPDELDMVRAQPGSPLAKDVWNRLTDASGMAKRIGLGALSGAAPAGASGELTGAIMSRRPAKTYGPETASLNAKYTPVGLDDLNALGKYQQTEAKNLGLLATVREDAQGLLAAAQRRNQQDAETARLVGASRQLDAGGLPPAGTSADLMAGPSGQQGLVPSQPRLAPARGSTGNPALPAPVKDPRGWANMWSEPARETVRQYIKSNPNAPLASLTAPELLAGIRSRLPEGSPMPAESTVRGYLKALREKTGDKPNAGTVKKTFASDPTRSLFAIPAIGAGLGMLSGDER